MPFRAATMIRVIRMIAMVMLRSFLVVAASKLLTFLGVFV